MNIINPFHTQCITEIPDSYPDHVPRSPITSLLDAAHVLAFAGANFDIAWHIENELKNGGEYENWRGKMPPVTPQILLDYQQLYPLSQKQMAQANTEVINHGIMIPHGQILFHGGQWKRKNAVTQLKDPFATTFCPQVAMREAEHSGKAYKGGYIDLMVITVVNPQVKAFVFDMEEPEKGNELEVLFASGAKISVTNRIVIGRDYPVYGNPQKEITTYLVEATLS
ncbi:hypothetical protein V6X57_24565 [Serratia bockelmannii]|uniref:hypothetical protein n=1 Tax=Serratia bockelmannii TaxID=2703793 RepID=UPI002FE6B1BD